VVRGVLSSLPRASILLLIFGLGATTPNVHLGSLYRSAQHALLANRGATAPHDATGEVVPAQREVHTVREGGARDVADVDREMGIRPDCW
jgi:hypothetical protein